MSEGDGFDWSPLGPEWWAFTADAAGIAVEPADKQLRFAVVRQRGATQAEAARLSGYVPDKDGSYNRIGSKTDASTKVRRLLAAAEDRLTGGSGRRDPVDDVEIEDILSRKARAGDMKAIAELRRQRSGGKPSIADTWDQDEAIERIINADAAQAPVYAGAVAIFLWLAFGQRLSEMPSLADAVRRSPVWLLDALATNLGPADAVTLEFAVSASTNAAAGYAAELGQGAVA